MEVRHGGHYFSRKLPLPNISSKDRRDELGYIGFDNASGTYVLWLKNHKNVFGQGMKYVRAEEWHTEEEAKSRAASSVSAYLANLIWQAQVASP